MPSFNNNNRTSSDLLICVSTGSTSETHAVPVVEWVAKVVAQTYPVASPGFPHMCVVGTLHSDRICEEGPEPKNELIVAVHQSCPDQIAGSFFHNSEFDGNVVVHEDSHPPPILCSANVADALALSPDIPDAVEDVGVSAISSEFMQQVWKEICSVNREYMDGNGDGYMKHRQYMYNEENGVFDAREMSFNFGWH